jgi:hypothetical protein
MKTIVNLLKGIFVLLIIQTLIQLFTFMRIDKTVTTSTENSGEKGVPAIRAIPNLPKTTIFFDSIFHDFGIIPETKKVHARFKFTNTGKEPLVIIAASGSCGCTVPIRPKEPIEPGKSNSIEVAFDPNGKSGEQTKMITITTNSEQTTTILTIKAIVEKSR